MAKGPNRVAILFTCVGRRVELLRAFQRAGKRLGLGVEIHGADASPLSPGLYHADHAHLVPRISSGEYIDELLEIVRRHGIKLLIPTIDSELLAIARAAYRFDRVGCLALISGESVIRTCGDKLATFRALRDAGLDTPRTWTLAEVMRMRRYRFPYFMKPRYGSAATSNHIIRTRGELQTFGRLVEKPILQEFVEGVEHTMDVYTGLDGVPRCVTPRRRLEVRSGEVSKAILVKNKPIMAVGAQVAEMLGECRGVVTVQCMVDRRRRIRVIEMNPRFGGGVPLAIHAGADYPKWILQERLGKRPRIRPDGFRDDVAMLRFDDSVFVPNAATLEDKKKPRKRRKK